MTEFRILIPGIPRNPLNGSWGHWSKHGRRARAWRDRTSTLIARQLGRRRFDPQISKTITFTLLVGALWDTDHLAGAAKPLRDGLMDAGVIQDDSPRSGHVFTYEQRVIRARTARGIEITIRLRDA